MSTRTTIRLNKFISDSGFCSRREADKVIDSNRVKINGQRAELGTRVEPGDTVTVDGQVIAASPENKSDRVYIAYNKPVGITCTTDRRIKGNIVDAIDHKERIFPIGRLDKPSEGLILLTSDGDIVNKILRAENAHEKEYLVTVNKSIDDNFVEKMSRGVPILDTVTKPCKVTPVGRSVFKIVLTQGLNRQIRRMCEYLGYDVTKLVRLRIMNIDLGRLKHGQWRNLSQQEMDELNASISHSKSEAKIWETHPSSREQKPRNKPRKNSNREHKKPSRNADGWPANRTNSSKGRKPGASKPSSRPGKKDSRKSTTPPKRRR